MSSISGLSFRMDLERFQITHKSMLSHMAALAWLILYATVDGALP
jgi:hypothetical protein